MTAITETSPAIENAASWLAEIRRMVAALQTARDADDTEAMETAEQEIHESALDVSVRYGWQPVGDGIDNSAGPEEFQILLTTGGPALRIYGTLDRYRQPDPDHIELQYQDWGTPWTELVDARPDRDTLAAFAACFYFGE